LKLISMTLLFFGSGLVHASAITCSPNYAGGRQDGCKCRDVKGDGEFSWSWRNAGMRESDVILSVDGLPIDSQEPMLKFMQKLDMHNFKEVIVRRDGRDIVLHPDPNGPPHYE
jgi:hypothetical protein